MRISFLAVTTALALAAATPALALKPGPGEYNWGDLQTICVRADGTWYGVTFADWGGRWEHRRPWTYFYGNYLGGLGNDAFQAHVVRRIVNITEWRDDLSFTNVLVGGTFTRTSLSCRAPASGEGAGAGSDPAGAE